MDKLSPLKATDICQYAVEECIAGYVEGNAEAHVAGPLVQETGEFVVLNVELGEHVARGKRHQRQVHWVPSRQDMTTTKYIHIRIINMKLFIYWLITCSGLI